MNKSQEVFDVTEKRAAVRASRKKASTTACIKAARAIEDAMVDVSSSVRKQQVEGSESVDYGELSRAIATVQSNLDTLRRRVNDVHIEKLRASAVERFRLASLDKLASLSDGLVQPSSGAAGSEPWRASIIYADPPWSYSNQTHKFGTATQYDTMSDEALEAMPVAGLAAEDAVLLMWATLPKLGAAMRLLNAWGFEYRTVFNVWVKVERYLVRETTGYGAYTRPNAEIVLLGVRGNMRTTLRNKGFKHPNVLLSRAQEHSRKPAILRDIAVKLFGDLPRIELFARSASADWITWGNQAATVPSSDPTADNADAVGGRVDSVPESSVHESAPARRRNNLSAGGLVMAQARASSKRRRRTSATPGKQRRMSAKQMPAATWHHLSRHEPHNTLGKNDAIHYYEDRPDRPERGADDTQPPDVALERFARLDEFFSPDKSRRHSTYQNLSEQQVADNAPLIVAAQQRNADRLFSLNNNKKAQRIQPALCIDERLQEADDDADDDDDDDDDN